MYNIPNISCFTMLAVYLYLVSAVVLFSLVKENKSEKVFVKFQGSTFAGSRKYSVLRNIPFDAFQKIPYAEPPIEELRFQAPRPLHDWYTENCSYDFSHEYSESNSFKYHEDCLYITVYSPHSDNESREYPVLVWIHEESRHHGPDFFIDEEIVVVKVSYRTSILGFLNTEDDFAKGNMGAKDVLMALKWIRDNINTFHGDPSKVTIAGAGSSASIVGSLLLSPAAEDLFIRVIIQSGSSLSPAEYRNYNFEILNKLFWNLNGPFEKFNRKRLYEMLTTATTEKLIMASQNLFDSTEVRDEQRLINSFGHTVELPTRQAFMTKNPIEVYKRRMTKNNVDVLMGYTSLESLYKLRGLANNRKLLRYLNFNFQYLLPFEGKSDEYDSRRYRRIKRKIKEFYFVNGTIGERSLRRYVKYVSDQVIYPVLRQARLHAQVSLANVYLYRFSFRGSLNVGWDSSVPKLNWTGATFGDEICYLFRCKSVNEMYNKAETRDERNVASVITRLWANYVKLGNPTPGNKDAILQKIHWDPLKNDQLNGLNLGKKIRMRILPEEKRMIFWDQLRKDYFPDRFVADEL